MRFKMFIAALLAFAGLADSGSAQAADTWLPDFKAGQTVYVSPRLEADGFRLDSDFAEQVMILSGKHNLKVYIVATEQGGDVPPDRRRWAPWLLHYKVWQKLEHEVGDFREDRTVVILWVRSRDNPQLSSTGVRVGSALHKAGVTRDRLGQENGPVMTAVRAKLPHDPRGLFLSVLQNLNTALDKSHGTAKAPSAAPEHSKQEGSGMTIVWLFVGILALLLLVGIVFAIFTSSTSHSDSRRSSRDNRGTSSPTQSQSGTTPTGNNSNPGAQSSGGDSTGSNVLGMGAAAAGGYLLGSAMSNRGAEAERERERRRREESSSSSSSSGSDASYPLIAGGDLGGSGGDSGGSSGGDSGGSSGGDSGGSSGGASCSGGSSCGGGGSSCGGGGGGCGGGGGD